MLARTLLLFFIVSGASQLGPVVLDVTLNPNPCHERTVLYLSEGVKAYHAYVYDSTGKWLFTVSTDIASSSFTIRTAQIQPGRYTVKVKGSNGKAIETQFIKN